MYVARRPSIENLARLQAYKRDYDDAVTSRGAYGGNWWTVGTAGQPSYLTGWTGDVQYMRDSEGFVYLRGAVNGPLSTGPLFYLPTGYRPPRRVVWPDASTFSIMGVQADGLVLPVYRSGSANLILDGFGFRIV